MDEQNIKKLKFEEAMASLEEYTGKLRSGSLSIEESMTVYGKCVLLYNHCKSILADARQKIELYNPASDALEDFEE